MTIRIPWTTEEVTFVEMQESSLSTDSRSDGDRSIPGFRAVTGFDPYPWQARLYQRLLTGAIPSAADVSTSGGKTMAVLLHLLALAQGAPLTRRIAYVVDRRAVVDQTATVIVTWIARIAAQPELRHCFDALAAFPSPSPIVVGVLRGGLADDGEWRLDPARPSVVIGTVDMLGSRLLFSGYGSGRSRRAMDAGLLGQDTTLYLDEAHLSPGFAGLLGDLLKHRSDVLRPGLRAMSLSATQSADVDVFRLDEDDLSHPDLHKRLHAVKRLHLESCPDRATRLARTAELAGGLEGSVLIYVRSVRDATALATAMRKQMRTQVDHLGLLTGTLRGAEREALTRSATWAAFQPDRARTGERYWLIATAAGEVGVDLDADHAVMDLTTVDALIQRLGRINRTGAGEAEVFILLDDKELSKARERVAKAEQKRQPPPMPDTPLLRTAELIANLTDGSPATLGRLPKRDRQDAAEQRATPAPLRDETIQALSLTAMQPNIRIDPLLHGISEMPQTPDVYLCWRWDVPLLVDAGAEAAADALALFPPEPREVARVPIGTANELLSAAIKRCSTLPIVLRTARGQVKTARLTEGDSLRSLAYATLILPVDAGGLRDGLPDPDSSGAVSDLGDSDMRLRLAPGAEPPPWLDRATTLRIPLDDDDAFSETTAAAEPRQLVYALRRYDPALAGADSDVSRLAATEQTLAEHSERVGMAAERIAEALELPRWLINTLAAAGRGHDVGKGQRRWQLAAGATGTAMAKSRHARFRPALLGGYRHEFGSLTAAERDGADELTLHLIAAHHGWARPGFPDPRHWGVELPDDLAAAAARRCADRFGCLQAMHGPWQLAWLEALVKAADAWVSSGRDRQDAGDQ